MLKLEDLKKDAQIRGLEGDKIVRIVSAEPVGVDAANVFYVDPDGKPGSQMLFRSDEALYGQNRPLSVIRRLERTANTMICLSKRYF